MQNELYRSLSAINIVNDIWLISVSCTL